MEKTNLFSRRSFLKTGMVLTAGLPVLRISPVWGKVTQPETEDKLYSLFRQPSVTAKPFVRWWWNGDKLSAKEILRELDVMKEAGIGGVEINPIAFPGGDDLGIPSMQWLSPEWIEMVKVALKGAEKGGWFATSSSVRDGLSALKYSKETTVRNCLLLQAKRSRGRKRSGGKSPISSMMPNPGCMHPIKEPTMSSMAFASLP